MRDKTRDQILERFTEQIKDLIKNLLEKLMLEERELYLEQHPTKGNGYYTRDLLTLFGPLEDLKVPRVREGWDAPVFCTNYSERTADQLTAAVSTISLASPQLRAAYSAGVRYPRELCGRNRLYSCLHASTIS